MDPMLDMANRVAGLPWAMHQSLEGEARRRPGLDWMEAHDSAFRVRSSPPCDRLRSAIREALLVDLPVTNEHRFEGIVDRLCAAVEALEERP